MFEIVQLVNSRTESVVLGLLGCSRPAVPEGQAVVMGDQNIE